MKNILKTVVGVFAVSGLFFAGCTNSDVNRGVEQPPVVVNPEKVSVYVTAKDTDLRLDAIGEFDLQTASHWKHSRLFSSIRQNSFKPL